MGFRTVIWWMRLEVSDINSDKKVTHANPYMFKPRPGTRYDGQEPTPEHVPEAARKTDRWGEKLSRKNRGPMTESSLKASDLIGDRPIRRPARRQQTEAREWGNAYGKERATKMIPRAQQTQ
jgi:hypothetical protein